MDEKLGKPSRLIKPALTFDNGNKYSSFIAIRLKKASY